MLPYITIGDLKIPFFSIGFSITSLVFILLCVHSAKQRKINEEYGGEIGAIISISAIIFSKIPIGIIYGWEIGKFFKFWESGHTLYGGIMVGIIITLIYSLIRKINFYDVLAMLTYPALFTLSAYRILVCLTSGCCFGFPSSSFGITFSDESWAGKVLGGTPKLFPSQIVEAIVFFLFGAIMYSKSNKKSEDQIILFLFLITLERFLAEIIRYDIKEKIIKVEDYGISIWFIISLFMFSATATYFKALLPWIEEVKKEIKKEQTQNL